MTQTVTAILDWGTSSLRATLISADGRVLDRRESRNGGIQFVEGGAFEAALMARPCAWFRCAPTR